MCGGLRAVGEHELDGGLFSGPIAFAAFAMVVRGRLGAFLHLGGARVAFSLASIWSPYPPQAPAKRARSSRRPARAQVVFGG